MTEATTSTAERETRSEKIAFLTIAGVERIARALPTHTGRLLFRWAGKAAYLLAPGPRATVAANLAQVLGRPATDALVTSATKEAFELYARYWFDAFHLMDRPAEEVLEAFRFEGLEHLRAAVEAGTGAIVLLPHLGNWDAAGRAIAVNGLPVVAVAEHLRPERLYRLFLRQREALGIEVIGLIEGTHVGSQLANALARNRIVSLVADRDLTGRGVEVEMFGRSRSLPAGPALLSITTGAPIFTAGVYQVPDGWECRISPMPYVELTGDRRADVTTITRAIGARFEEAIAAAPTDWHMFQPAWEG